MKCFKTFLFIPLLLATGCATLTNDATVPVALSFSDGSFGSCHLKNKRYSETVTIPATMFTLPTYETAPHLGRLGQPEQTLRSYNGPKPYQGIRTNPLTGNPVPDKIMSAAGTAARVYAPAVGTGQKYSNTGIPAIDGLIEAVVSPIAPPISGFYGSGGGGVNLADGSGGGNGLSVNDHILKAMEARNALRDQKALNRLEQTLSPAELLYWSRNPDAQRFQYQALGDGSFVVRDNMTGQTEIVHPPQKKPNMIPYKIDGEDGDLKRTD